MTVRPVTANSAGELHALVHEAARQRVAIVDYGTAHRGVGYAPPAERIELTQHGSVLEHYVRDFTVRVAAGATLGEVQEVLAGKKQFLPLEAPGKMSIGECLMHNVYGPLRTGYGALRDQVLGLNYVDGLGRDIHVGGRTVKNVAGYDVARFMVGSLGELGLVYEVTLRTFALPEQVMQARIRLDDPRVLGPRLNGLLLTVAAPAGLSLYGDAEGWVLEARYLGASTRAWPAQLRGLEEWCRQTPQAEMMSTNAEGVPQVTRSWCANSAWRDEKALVVKVVVPPARTGEVCTELKSESGVAIAALPAQGCIWVGSGADDAVALDRAVANAAGQPHLRQWHRRPSQDNDKVAPLTPQPSDLPLLRRLKSVMDPHGLFNPGRFLPAEGAMA